MNKVSQIAKFLHMEHYLLGRIGNNSFMEKLLIVLGNGTMRIARRVTYMRIE